jgi:hypothetical protein
VVVSAVQVSLPRPPLAVSPLVPSWTLMVAEPTLPTYGAATERRWIDSTLQWPRVPRVVTRNGQPWISVPKLDKLLESTNLAALRAEVQRRWGTMDLLVRRAKAT